MKKTLLGTTALVSAGLVAGPALASDPLTVSVSGSIVTGFYFVDADNVGGNDIQDTKVAIVARDISVNAEGTLDNGLVAGATAQLQLGDDEGGVLAERHNATFTEVYAYLEGGFGRAEIGGTDGAAFKMHYSSPWFVPGNGVDSPNIYNGASTTGTVITAITPAPGVFGYNIATTGAARTSTYALMTEDSNKISYFTPRLAGFQLGLSFTPDTSNNNPTSNGFGLAFTGSSFAEDVIEIAVNYAGEFGGASVGVDGFYVTGDGPTGGGDPEEWGLGANVGFGGFTVGGAYYANEDLLGQNVAVFSGLENETWTAGVSYGTGPWTVGVAYLESESEILGVSLGENSFWQVGGGYSLGAGVDLGLDIQLIEETNAAGTDFESNSAGLVLAISF